MAYEESPAKNLNKGYAGQEKKDLMNDNPIAKDASGGRGGSWMSKHSQSRMGGSPLMAAKPDYIDIDGDGNKSESMKSAAKDSPARKEGGKGGHTRTQGGMLGGNDRSPRTEAMDDAWASHLQQDHHKGSAAKMKGSMKGDQSASRSDYSMDSGDTDRGYKGKDGSSKGDQSASKADYMKK